MKNEMKRRIRPTFTSSLVVMIIAVGLLIYGVAVLGQNPHVVLLFSCAVLLLYGLLIGVPWKDMRASILKSISESIETMLIICLIGILVGVLMASGTVPTIIYYGLKIFSPSFFLPSVLLLCALMSITTGSSWTTIGTIGIAFIGISYGMNIPIGITAGAIICGAYFGDKQSPVSDSTNFAAAVAKTGLYDHTRSMLWSTTPSFLVSLIIFTIIGTHYQSGSIDAAQIRVITDGIADTFWTNPVLLIPLVVMIVMILKKMPAIPTMMIAIGLGLIEMFFFQHQSPAEILQYMYSGFASDTGIETVDRLLTRGGLTSMTSTVALMLMSLMMAGLMQADSIMDLILSRLGRITGTRFGLIATTLISCIVLSFFASDPYLAMLIPANVLGEKYDELGLDRSVLSRTLEDGATIICPMVPWGTNGIYCANALGISVSTYLPYYFMGWLTPVFSLILAAADIGCKRAEKEAES
jgi:NhaC family Na+:H+ antiporter